MPPRNLSSLLTLANLLIPIAILSFASGFFPYKPFLPGLATYEDTEDVALPPAPFDKVVFMVVDALRSDFVFSEGSGFQFTQSLISDGFAIPFTAHATSPTITLPRIKAITTGSIPSFLDVILNFAESDTTSSLDAQDTWLAQMKAKGTGKMVMFGDDTWIKLFPSTFDRVDGTSSFFVADFTEVDRNVTRNLPSELENDDWNTMILHYLGLDHIGHKAGPNSPNMNPKQVEMDSIVQLVYEAIKVHKRYQNTLLVLCGDHGMTDGGNHGGSTAGETSPALVFISPKIKSITTGNLSPSAIREDFQYYSTVEQSDIAPTLGGLLGFPSPKNNLGVFITNFLPFWPQDSDKVNILKHNAKQILNIVTAAFPKISFQGRNSTDCILSAADVERLACRWGTIGQQLETLERNGFQNFDEVLNNLTSWSKDAQAIMSSTASNYNITRLVVAQVIALTAVLLASLAALPTLSRSFRAATPFLLLTIAYGLMTFASSYVEEEQHYWYWIGSGWLAWLCLKGTSTKSMIGPKIFAIGTIGALAALRITRRWNQTGQKFAGEPDIARTFLSHHSIILWNLVSATYFWNAALLASNGFPRLPRSITTTIAAVLFVISIDFKLAFTMEDAPELMQSFTFIPALLSTLTGQISLVTRARGVFLGIAMALFQTSCTELSARKRRPMESLASLRTIHDLICLFLITQSRTLNIPLLLLFDFQSQLLAILPLSLVETTVTSLILQYSSFFAFGGTNALSSIDLSSAYNGVSGYNIIAVGLLTFAGNWIGPIYWTSATSLMLVRLHRQGEKNVLQKHLALLTVFVTVSLMFVMAACTALRTHLFIWTVFSPKYLYSMAWIFGQHFLINMGLGSLLFWLGTRR